MKLLFSSDWQAGEENLDKCETVLEELEMQARQYQPDAIIFPGDLKEAYSPVSVNVVRFWVRAITRLTADYRVIVMRGNHDRVSQSRKSADWLSVMRAAGAETVAKPKIKAVGGHRGGIVSFLPFTADKALEKQWAQFLADEQPKYVSSSGRVLVFHTLLHGVVPVAQGITADELHAQSYNFCIGGDVHEHQFIKPNIWYVGSPFTHSWGEVNQKKGNLFLDTTQKKPVFLPTKIPIWYDAEHLHEWESKPYTKGCQIRSRVNVTSKNITQQIRDEEKRLLGLYPDAIPHVIPKLVTGAKDDDLDLSGKTDDERVGQYVAATFPDKSRFDAKDAVKYMTDVLGRMQEGTVGTRLDFLRASGNNVLSFKTIEVDYRKQGIVLLRGVRKDWNKRSNGAGKSNLLSLLPIGLFGQTLKGQKADAWAREDTDEKAELKLVMRDSSGRRLKVERTRRPHGISLERQNPDKTWTDLSEGIRGTGKAETQGLVEKVTGFDLRMLTNSVYIDQTVANGFVFGTQKDRMDLVSKLQNLGRYESALKMVTADIKKQIDATELLQVEAAKLQAHIDYQTASLGELVKEKKREGQVWEEKLAKAQKTLTQLVEAKSSLMGDEKMYGDYRKRISEWGGDLTTLEGRLARYRASVASGKTILERAQKLIDEGKCYVCGQASGTVGKKYKASAESEIEETRKKAKKCEDERTELEERIEVKQKSLDRWERELERAEDEIEAGRTLVKELTEAAKAEKTRAKELDGRISDAKDKLAKTEKQLKRTQAVVREGDIHREMLDYAQKAVQRGGMPLYLASSLCSFLNKAADEYAEIFTDGKISAAFEVLDGEFQVAVVNASGSVSNSGQSMGESAMAGIVAAFALRDASPKSNLLVLDEPGSNLDPEGCRQFANGILKLKDRWETIIITTHSPIIEGILAGETVWTVRKTGKVSRLIQT